MTKEQEIRAFALMIAEIKNKGGFFNVKNCEGSIIELNERQVNYLQAIERYIDENNYWSISDNGRKLEGTVT
jgi:hypothetical protein